MKIKVENGRRYDAVYVNGYLLDPARSQAVFNHSPDGFSWGYGGSGPAQLALALLLEAGLSDTEAVRLHQRFKDEYVAKWPQTGTFELELDVAAWAVDAAAEVEFA